MKKFTIFGIIILIETLLALTFVFFPEVNSVEEVAPTEVLVFLKDVAQLDVTQYESTLMGTMMSYPDELANIPQMSGKYRLKSKTNELDVLFKFKNYSLCWVFIRINEGEPILDQQPNITDVNDVDNAKVALQRYQTFSEDANLELMRNMLDTVDVATNITKTVNNVKLEIERSSTISFSWRNSFNGADYSGLYVKFQDGFLIEFRDDRSYYTIGGTEVNINKEEAINFALDHVKNFSWIMDTERVTNFIIVKEYISAELLTRSREALELYPYWMISLPLDRYYPGNVYAISVTVWADTLEIIDCFTLSVGGDLLINDTIDHSNLEGSTNLQQLNSSIILNQSEVILAKNHNNITLEIGTILFCIVIVLFILIAVAASLKKRGFVKKF